MHKLYEYACDELKELEKKAEKGLSAAELEYADKLTELKKNILKIEMLEGDSEYSGDDMRNSRRSYYNDYRGSYRTRRDSMGRYSRAKNDIVSQLEDMIPHAPDEKAKRDIRELIDKMENA